MQQVIEYNRDICEAISEPEVLELRKMFPFFERHPQTVYLDSSATTLKPIPVIEAAATYYTDYAVNVCRGKYALARKTESFVAEMRERVARFISPRLKPSRVFFGQSATASLQAFYSLWSSKLLKHGDSVFVGSADHRANVSPWLTLREYLQATGRGISVEFFKYKNSGVVDTASLVSKNSEQPPKAVALTLVHNVFGSVNPLLEIKDSLLDETRLFVDCSQSPLRTKLHHIEQCADFAVFSPHKMLGPMGLSVVVLSERMLEELSAFRHWNPADVNEAFFLDEGTPNIPAIFQFDAAIQFIEAIGYERIKATIRRKTELAYRLLSYIDGISYLPGPGRDELSIHSGILSFRVDGASASELGEELDSRGYVLRTGEHCVSANPVTGNSLRLSVQFYTSDEEITRFVSDLSDICFHLRA